MGCDAIRGGNIPGIPKNPSLNHDDSAVTGRNLSAKTKKRTVSSPSFKLNLMIG
jgi:hypothetical protein